MTQQSESQAMAHEATLFVMQMAGDSMINAGIHNGDLLIVDRSLAPVPGDVVAAVMDDEIAIKRLVSRAGITYCTPRIRDTPITCRATALRLLSGASSPMSFTR